MMVELRRFQESTGCQVRFDTDSEVMPSLNMGVTLYRIFHEALMNVRRHANGVRSVMTSLRYREQLVCLEVQDDGCGFDAETSKPEGGVGGLMSMSRRAEAIGGSFEVTSVLGQGTRVRVCVPFDRGEP